jgi:hypothetical protein
LFLNRFRIFRASLSAASLLLSCAITHASPDDGTWANFSTAGMPPSEGTLTSTDDAHHRVYMFGRRMFPSSGSWTNDVYVLDLSGSPRFERLSVSGIVPSPRSGSCLVFDSARGRLLLIGGISGWTNITETEVWELSLGSPARWTQLQPQGTIPPPRSDAVAVLDPLGDRVILYGGTPPGGSFPSTNETWELDLAPVPTWSKLATAGAVPSGLSLAAAVYDSRRHRMLVYGAPETIDRSSRDLWSLTLEGIPTWSLLQVSGTEPPLGPTSYDLAAVYDSTADCVHLMVSQLNLPAPVPLGLFRLDLAAGNVWSVPATIDANPGARFMPGFALDSSNRQLLVIGGRTEAENEFRSDAYALDLTTLAWANLEPVGAEPITRIPNPVEVLDSELKRILLLAGTASPEFWVLRLDTAAVWERRRPTTAVPAFAGEPAVYDSVNRRVLVFDSATSGTLTVWSLTVDPTPACSIVPVSSAGPPARSGVAVLYDPPRKRVLVFGGNGGSPSNELWELSLVGTAHWTLLANSGPAPRWGSLVACDQGGQRLVLFGGRAGSTNFQDVWTWSLTNTGWTQLNPTGIPPPGPGTGRSFVYDPRRDRLVQAGNAGLATSLQAWSLALGGSPSWTTLQPVDRTDTAPYGPGLYLPWQDRVLFPAANYLTGTALQFGSAEAPVIECPPPGPWSPGTIRQVSFAVQDQLGLGAIYEYELTADRDWPGMPVRGLVPASDFGTAYATVGIPVPDTAALGRVTFGLSVASRDQGGLASVCSFELDGEPAPIVARGAKAEFDRVVLNWETGRAGLPITVSRREEAGSWAALRQTLTDDSRHLVYEDRSVRSGQRYYYHVEVTSPELGGVYGQLQVDVPRAEVGFASDQSNPIVGAFLVRAIVDGPGEVRLDAYDVLGRRVLSDRALATTPGRVTFQGIGTSALRSGVYFLRLAFNGRTLERRVVYLK